MQERDEQIPVRTWRAYTYNTGNRALLLSYAIGPSRRRKHPWLPIEQLVQQLG